MQADNTCYVCLNTMTPTDSCKLPECDHWIHTRCMINCITTNNSKCGVCRAQIVEPASEPRQRPELTRIIIRHMNSAEITSSYRIDYDGNVYGIPPNQPEIWKERFIKIKENLKTQGVSCNPRELQRMIKNLDELYPNREHLPNYTQWKNYAASLANYFKNILRRKDLDEMANSASISKYKNKTMDELRVLLRAELEPHYLATGGVPCPADQV